MEPSAAFLTELAYALKQATHKNVAQRLAAGMLWALYPKWFTDIYVPSLPRREKGK